MTGQALIRQALAGDRAAVVATVTGAFAEDPAWRFILDGDYARLAPEFAGSLFDLRAPGGNVWLTDDGASAAMWEGPGRGGDPGPAPEQVWTRYEALAGQHASARLGAYRAAVTAAAPADPYWYLGVLATRPGRQGEGLASAVLAPVLDEADRLGITCCLETSTQANRRFYERRGFVLASEVTVPEGPPTWWLRRPASGRASAGVRGPTS